MNNLERRFKIGYVSNEDLLNIFAQPPPAYPNENDTFIKRALCFQGLPSDVCVHHVFWDNNRMQFGIVLWSNDFPIVPDAEIVPAIPITTYEVYHDNRGQIMAVAMLWKDYPDKVDGRESVGSEWRTKPPLF